MKAPFRYLACWHAMPSAQCWMLGVLAAAVALVNIRQPFPDIAPLQHIPTVLLILLAPILAGRRPMSNRAVAAPGVFFLLHTLGGRYTYSNVPYDAWALALTGHDITNSLGLARNMYDRLVHLAFGVLWVAPVAEGLRRHGGFGRRAAGWTAFLFVGAVSAAYEVFEWLLTMLLAPGMAADYNGQQGDMWDAQKDMGIAMLGAALSCLTLRNGRER